MYSSDMRIDGYYYGESKILGINNVRVYMFHQDGSMFYWGSTSRENLNRAMKAETLKQLWAKEYFEKEVDWGLFQVKEDELKFEYWSSRERRPGKYKTQLWTAEILNDSTFIVKRVYNNYQKKTSYPNTIYKFQQFN